MDVNENGFRAKYEIEERELEFFLGVIWERFETKTGIEREHSIVSIPFSSERMKSRFESLDWAMPENIKIYAGPRWPNGGGATFYVDLDTGTVFQTASLW